MKMNETKRRHIAFALTAVLLNEDGEEFTCGLEEIAKISDIFGKICDALDEEDLKALAHVRPDTFIKSMKTAKEIDDMFEDFK